MEKRPPIPALTSLRFLAAMFVVLFHYNAANHTLAPEVSTFGYSSVTFFFVLSGFVLVYTHATEIGLNVSATEFYRRRFRRLSPSYLVALALALPFYLIGGFSFPSAATVLLMLQSWWPRFSLDWNPPAWSLSNEAFFYFTFPALFILARSIGAKAAMFLAYALIAVAAIGRSLITNHDLAAYFPLLNIPQFMLGIALGLFFLRPIQRDRELWCVLLALALLGIVLLIILNASTPLIGSVEIVSVPFAFLIFAAANAAYAPTFLTNAPLLFLGECSYEIYILHVPVWLYWNHLTSIKWHLNLSPLNDLFAYLALVLFLSITVHMVVDRRKSLLSMAKH